MQETIKKTGIVFVEAAVFFLLIGESVLALDPGADLRKGFREAGGENIDTDGTTFLLSEGGIFERIANALIILIGAVSVVMVIVGGFRYVTSQGDSSATESAKNTILYSLIGVVVAFFSYAAVQFVITQLGPQP